MATRPRTLGSIQTLHGDRASGRQAMALLWRTSRMQTVLVLLWVALQAVVPGLVVVALGVVVGEIPAAVADGLASTAGGRLLLSLLVASVVYAVSLILDPVGSALATSVRARITAALQGRLLAAVSEPVGVGHLEDPDVLDRLGRAEGTLTGFFPGDAPVTWAGNVAARLSGVVGCAIVAVSIWWLGLALFAIWFLVRRLMLGAVLRQATELRAQTTEMRRSWYFLGLGTRARDAKEIRVFGLPEFVADRFRQANLAALLAAVPGLRTLHLRAVLGLAIVFCTYAGALVAIVVEAHLHELSLRSLAILFPMLAVTAAWGNISYDDIVLAWSLGGIPDVETLERRLDDGERQLPGRAPADGVPTSCVRFEQVRFRYPSGHRDVLAGVDLELVAGTSTAIVGVNGAGKSTLVGLLSRLRDPTAGRITVDGRDVRELDPTAWQRAVAIMPQEPARYPVSAYDNVAFGALEHRDDREGVEEAARLAGFLEVVPHLPRGWDTVLARELPGGVDLSGGQWQRLALARALFANRHGARLLVLDEPTAALDVRSEARFYQQFLEIARGLTTVVISHRFATVRRADRICVLDGGVITERGTHEELVREGGVYARMYRTQAARFRGAG
jgi:ATP-binding cassette, subfamily B, bacterial